MSYKDRKIPAPVHVARTGVAGREQGVIVSPKNELVLIGCDGPLTPKQAATARTLIDDALIVVAEREGPQVIPSREPAPAAHPDVKVRP